jgi:hypothetical protein
MRSMMTWTARRAALAAGAAAGVLAVAACSGSGTPTPSGSPLAPTDAGASSANRLGQLSVLVVQCFADHKLIPASALNSGKTGNPPYDSSAWLHGGKVTGNELFGSWYSGVGAGVTVKGKIIGEWVSEIATNSRAWPSSVCGPMPSVSS